MVHDKGYLRIMAGPCRGRYVHELIAEAKIGRPLYDGEQAHHIDHDKLNCHPDNIEVIPSDQNSAEGAYYRDYGMPGDTFPEWPEEDQFYGNE